MHMNQPQVADRHQIAQALQLVREKVQGGDPLGALQVSSSIMRPAGEMYSSTLSREGGV